jgi:hypothetical protein
MSGVTGARGLYRTTILREMLIFVTRSLWIAEEKELVHEIAGLGELRPVLSSSFL